MMPFERRMLAACGIDCSHCAIHLRAKEELTYWRNRGIDPEEVRCCGCRSSRREATPWSPDCGILNCCVDLKGLEFCSQCVDIDSCALMVNFAAEAEHHVAAIERLRAMRRVGVDRWLAENCRPQRPSV